MKILIKDTTCEEREEIVRSALDCGGGGCENCSSCCLGGGDPYNWSYCHFQKGLPRQLGA